MGKRIVIALGLVPPRPPGSVRPEDDKREYRVFLVVLFSLTFFLLGLAVWLFVEGTLGP